MSASKDEKTFAQALADAETAMHAMRLATDSAEKKRLTEQVKQLLHEAETIKANADGNAGQSATKNAKSDTGRDMPHNSNSTGTILKEPASTRTMPKSEQILLLKASFLNGNKFPPWTGEPSLEEFQLKDNDTLFEDDAIFSLSSFQQQVFAGWERPVSALASSSPHCTTATEPTMDHIGTIDLVQDASTDCSVVASLCAGVARALRGHARLLRPVLFPQDTEAGLPMLSGSGKYIVRLNFNGCYRRVILDDRLPKSKTERVIHVIDRVNPTLLWPALVEKAYLKIRGGYDFPGSNSATDLWIITGWIPEQVFLQSDDLDLDGLWTKVLNAFVYGDVLVTMGTGKMSRKLEKEVGLAGEHDYAIIDMKEVRGQRVMLVKNPWCEGTNWFRMPTPQPKDLVAAQSSPADEMLGTQSPRDLLNADDQLSPGTFWMDINNAAQYFESIYLNWNPGLFAYRQDMHFAWDMTQVDAAATRGRHASLYNNPQFSVSSHSGGTIWILLCRHLRNAFESMPGSVAPLDLSGFIALSAFAAGGKRVKLAGRSLNKSNFVDSPQILLKLQDCQPDTLYTILPLEQELASAFHTFTISAFSTYPLTLDHALPAHPYVARSSSSWNRDTAGGNVHSVTYSTNPQFAVVLTRATNIATLLESANEELNVHVKMVHGKGQRVRNVRNRDIVLDSSDYRRKCCASESKAVIDAGSYTMICSTYEPQQFGNFDLLVEADEPFSLTPLPREDSGRLRVDTKAVFPKDGTKIAAKLQPLRLSNIYLKARRSKNTVNTSSMPLRISIEQGQGAYRRILTTSEDDEQLASDIERVRLNEFDLSPSMLRYGDLWVVLERVCIADHAEELSVDIHCFVDQLDAIEFGPWILLND